MKVDGFSGYVFEGLADCSQSPFLCSYIFLVLSSFSFMYFYPHPLSLLFPSSFMTVNHRLPLLFLLETEFPAANEGSEPIKDFYHNQVLSPLLDGRPPEDLKGMLDQRQDAIKSNPDYHPSKASCLSSQSSRAVMDWTCELNICWSNT